MYFQKRQEISDIKDHDSMYWGQNDLQFKFLLLNLFIRFSIMNSCSFHVVKMLF